MPSPRMVLTVFAMAVAWSACTAGRPIVVVTDDAGPGSAGASGGSGSGAAGTGGAGTTGTGGRASAGAGGDQGGRGNAAGAAVAGGRGGSSAGGGAGTAAGGGAGTGSGGTAVVGIGTLIDCPASPPSGACSVNFMNCAYPTTSCRCSSGTWSCQSCPSSPEATNIGSACAYGNVTCSTFGCGICPDAHPTAGAACGNTTFKCLYGEDVCFCGGNLDGWKCAALSCPEHPTNADNRRINCATFTLSSGTGVSFDHACRYETEGQSCACNDGSGFGTFMCSCPATLPAEGSACVGVGPCNFGGATCNCSDGAWRCGGACPASKPALGTACSGQLSCSYPGANGATDFCSCDGVTWSCVN